MSGWVDGWWNRKGDESETYMNWTLRKSYYGLMMSIMMWIRPMRHVPLVIAVQSFVSEQGTSFLDPGYGITKPLPRKPGSSLSLYKGATCDPNASNNDVASVRFLRSPVSSVLSNNRISEALTHRDQSKIPTISLTQRNGYHERWTWLFIHSHIHPRIRMAPPRSICTVRAQRSW